MFSAAEFIAALLAHLPPKGVPHVRYYGWYSNKSRDLRARKPRPSADPACAPIPPPPPRPARRRRTAWRDLIKQVWDADPLQCPLCSGLLRPIALVETAVEIHAVLAPLGLARPHERPFTGGPPLPEVTVLVDAESGTAHPVDSPHCASRLPYPRPRAEPLRYRAEMMAAGDDFRPDGLRTATRARSTGGGDRPGPIVRQRLRPARCRRRRTRILVRRLLGELGFCAAQKPDDYIQADAPESC